jgi:VanZ family protein
MGSQRSSPSRITTSSTSDAQRRDADGVAAHVRPQHTELPDRTSKAARAGALLFLLAAVVFLETPGGQEFFHVLQKTGHSITFGIAALLVLSFLRSRKRALLADCAIALAVTVALGALTEVAQIYSHRDPSVVDVLRDSLGAVAALAGALWITSRSVTAAVVCLASVVLVMAPMAVCLAAYANRDLRYPVLWQFSSPLDMYFARDAGEGLARITAPARWQRGDSEEWALYVPLSSTGASGVSLTETYPDWTGRDRLLIDVTNPMPSPVQLTLRIEDRQHNQEYTDRFNADYRVPAATRQTISVALQRVEAAPRGRHMDMRHVAKVVLFRSAGSGSGFLVLNRMWLE